MNVIFTSYFTTKPDPQRGGMVQPNDIEKVRNWCLTVARADAVPYIFCDNYDNTFVKLVHEINPNICFEYTDDLKYSTNDSRFFIYKNFLDSGKLSNIEYILMTDCFDLTFAQDPFDFMKMTGFPLYFGDDSDAPIRPGDWMYELSMGIYGSYVLNSDPLCNAGVIGGPSTKVYLFLEEICKEMSVWGKYGNSNMMAVNKTLQTKYSSADYYRGVPFTSRFKMYEDLNKTYYIIHK